MVEDGATIPVGDFGLRTRLADAVNGGQQEVMGSGRTGARRWPDGLQDAERSGVLSGQPERSGQPELDGGGGNGNRRGAVLNEFGDSFGGTEVGLLNDAGFAVDAGAVDDVVIELVGLFLGHDGGHIG